MDIIFLLQNKGKKISPLLPLWVFAFTTGNPLLGPKTVGIRIGTGVFEALKGVKEPPAIN